MDRESHDTSVYRLLFEKSLDGVLLSRPDGTFLDANATACALLGMTKEEICSGGREALLAPGPDADRALEERARTGSVSAEVTFVRKDGSTFPAEFSSVLLPGDGDAAQAFVLFRDISERKKAEEALRQSEARLVRAQSVAHVGNWEIELPQGTMWGSAEAFRIYGVERVEPTTELSRAQAIVVPEDRAGLDRALNELIAGDTPYDYEFRIQRPSDGSIRSIHSTAEVVRDGDGRPVRVVGVIQDVTEQRQVEERLRLMQSAVDHAMDLIVVTDSDARIVWASDTWCKTLGYSFDEALTLSLADTDPTFDPEVWVEAWSIMKNEGGLSIEGVLRKRSGETFPVEINSNYLEHGGREYHIGSARDITARRAAEQALSQSEDRLRQSQKMQAIGELAGGIAHDFNNLLTAILGYTELLLTGEYAENQNLRSDLEEIRSAAERASALTRQILAFSRRQPLLPQRLSLNDVLIELEPLLRRSLGEDIELVCELQSDLSTVEVDKNQFAQVLMNLAVNARDAMPMGGRLVFKTADVFLDDAFLLAHPEAAPGGHVMVSVADTGVGMDEDTLGRIFEPFFTTKDSGRGTGLGLSTVYGIVRQSGGITTVESELGRGTTFRVYLPRVLAPQSAVTTGAAAQSSQGRRRGMVLVVEDDTSLRNLTARVLRSVGYQVVAAGSGSEALSTLERLERPPDLLLTDVVLEGGMHGNELAEMARRSSPGLPVLFMSGHPRDAVARARHFGEGTDVLQKPFTPEKLAKAVGDALEHRA